MTDLELLQDAAKAAGAPFANLLSHGKWNPLTDDGDAFRLAVGLGFLVDTNGDRTRVGFPFVSYSAIEAHGDDARTATRRAIVRAAAAMAAGRVA